MLVLLTDGRQTQDERTSDFIIAGDNAKPLKEKNITIYAIGIGSADPIELQAIASEPRTAIPATFNNLVSLADNIVREYCKGQLFGFSNSPQPLACEQKFTLPTTVKWH